MAIVLYVGGSRDVNKNLVPHGFTKSRADTDVGPEIYTERFMELQGLGRVRVMALESLQDEAVRVRAAQHYR